MVSPTSNSDYNKHLSNGSITAAEANAKLVLGFPFKDGSFPVGKANLNQGGPAQFGLVEHGVDVLKYNVKVIILPNLFLLHDLPLAFANATALRTRRMLYIEPLDSRC